MPQIHSAVWKTTRSVTLLGAQFATAQVGKKTARSNALFVTAAAPTAPTKAFPQIPPPALHIIVEPAVF